MLVELEGRQDALHLGVRNCKQVVLLDALDHREVDKGKHVEAGSFDNRLSSVMEDKELTTSLALSSLLNDLKFTSN